MTVGLALGGGGPVGIAWEIGVMSALVEAGFDLDDVTTVVGTSAGAVVGSQLVNRSNLAQLVAAESRSVLSPGLDRSDPSGPSNQPPVPPTSRRSGPLGEIFAILGDQSPRTESTAARVGGMAVAAETAPEQQWLANFERLLDGLDWVDTDLRITTVDCGVGRRRVWTASDGVPLHQAVAASCAVPGMFPPVTIDQSRYTDGGVWSMSNADLLADAEISSAVFIGPIGATDTTLSAPLQREQELLESHGIDLITIGPGDEFRERIGMNLLDPGFRSIACEVGRNDGTAAVERLASFI